MQKFLDYPYQHLTVVPKKLGNVQTLTDSAKQNYLSKWLTLLRRFLGKRQQSISESKKCGKLRNYRIPTILVMDTKFHGLLKGAYFRKQQTKVHQFVDELYCNSIKDIEFDILRTDFTIIPWTILRADGKMYWTIAVIDSIQRVLRWYDSFADYVHGKDVCDISSFIVIQADCFHFLQWLVKIGVPHETKEWSMVVEPCLQVDGSLRFSEVHMCMNTLCVSLGLPVWLWGTGFIQEDHRTVDANHLSNLHERIIKEVRYGQFVAASRTPPADSCYDICCKCTCKRCEEEKQHISKVLAKEEKRRKEREEQ